MKTKIEAIVVAHSKCPRGHELITYELTFPRFILAELNTHRMFSKNSASSRAIPFKKMVEAVQNDPFIPIAWQKDHKGMQGVDYFIDEMVKDIPGNPWNYEGNYTISHQNKMEWLQARNFAIEQSKLLNSLGLTKQLCNRLLEPFMWHKVILTTGKEGLQNFFELRCPQYEFSTNKIYSSWKDLQKENNNVADDSLLNRLQTNKGQAEIHMMELAEQMYDAYNESTPEQLEEGSWHIPYKNEIPDLHEVDNDLWFEKDNLNFRIKASVGKCARVSYLTVGDDKTPTVETLIGIHDKMLNSKPFHASPFEHCARVMDENEYQTFINGNVEYTIITQEGGLKQNRNKVHYLGYDNNQGWCRNFRGFIQYRHIVETENEKISNINK